MTAVARYRDLGTPRGMDLRAARRASLIRCGPRLGSCLSRTRLRQAATAMIISASANRLPKPQMTHSIENLPGACRV